MTNEHGDAGKVDYASMSAGDMHYALGMDAEKWTEAFYQIVPQNNVPRDQMFGWVCNMIMAGFDAANGGGPLCGDHAEFLLAKAASEVKPPAPEDAP